MTTTSLSPNQAPSATRNLSALFDPASIAVVGASNDPAKYGNWLAARALRGPRPAYLINKSRPSILDNPAFPSLVELDRPVDLAVIAVPAAGFYDALEDAIAAKVKAIVAVTAGLGEQGTAERLKQEALVERLREAGISLLGPNCLGVLDNTTGLDATVNDFRPGSISVISQSGNVAIDLAGHLDELGLGVSRFASLGNCADLDASDLIDSCVEHDGTDAIAVYCEGFKDGRRFLEAATRAAQANKPLVLLSVGRGEASARGAASHTGSMVTSGIVLEAVCGTSGAEMVNSPLEMANLLQGLVRTKAPAGRRIAVFADGGGHASVASDNLEARGLQVEEFSATLAEKLASELPSTASVSNPIDIAGGGEQDITCFSRTAAHLVASPETDAVLMTGYFGGYADYDAAAGAAEIQQGRDLGSLVMEARASFVAQTIFADSEPARALRESGIAVYRNVEHAAWVLSRLTSRATRKPVGTPPPLYPAQTALTETNYALSREAMTEAGIPFVPAREVQTTDEMRAAAAELTFPLVLKALGDEHKSDRGGVIVGIKDQQELETAWFDIQTRLAPPTCSLEVMADLSDAVELIMGVRKDPTFGTVVLVGIGGVFTELLKDTRCALGPISIEAAKDLILTLRGGSLLTGYRNKLAVDLDAAAKVMSDLSHFAARHPEIAELECNPVAVTPTSAVALDARIILG